MKKRWMFMLLAVIGDASYCEAGPAYRSPEILVADSSGTSLFITEVTSQTVAVMDLANGSVTRRYALSGPPSGMVLTPDDRRLFVTCGIPKGTIQIFDLVKHQVTDALHAGHTPRAPVLDSQGKRLFVCNRFDNEVSVFDLSTHRRLQDIPVPREPLAAVLSRDGRWLLVVNGLPADRSDGAYVAAEISVINTENLRVSQSIQLPNGSTSLQGICLSPDGREAYVTHILARYHLPTTQLERGWMNTNALSIIDMERLALLNTVLLDNVDHGAANPWQPLHVERKRGQRRLGRAELDARPETTVRVGLGPIERIQRIAPGEPQR